jgi:hypothetical protein
MKKLFIIIILAFFFVSCATSPYVGTWQEVDTGGQVLREIVINDDGTAVASWKEDNEKLVNTGTWKAAKNDSIVLDSKSAKYKANMVNDKLVLETTRKVRHHLIRRTLRK